MISANSAHSGNSHRAKPVTASARQMIPNKPSSRAARVSDAPCHGNIPSVRSVPLVNATNAIPASSNPNTK